MNMENFRPNFPIRVPPVKPEIALWSQGYLAIWKWNILDLRNEKKERKKERMKERMNE